MGEKRAEQHSVARDSITVAARQRVNRARAAGALATLAAILAVALLRPGGMVYASMLRQKQVVFSGPLEETDHGRWRIDGVAVIVGSATEVAGWLTPSPEPTEHDD
jgi:hypothetical protein